MFYTGYAIMKDKSKIPNTFIHNNYSVIPYYLIKQLLTFNFSLPMWEDQ
jgi:hypothetical protein